MLGFFFCVHHLVHFSTDSEWLCKAFNAVFFFKPFKNVQLIYSFSIWNLKHFGYLYLYCIGLLSHKCRFDLKEFIFSIF